MAKMILAQDMVLAGTQIQDKETLFRTLCAKAQAHGFVQEGFADALVARETEFPTGLETPVPLAMPHVGVCCSRSFMAVATLPEPMEFGSMSGGEAVPVRLVFLFGIVEPQEQVVVLRKFSSLFQNAPFLEGMAAAADTAEILALMRENLGELLELA